MSGDLLKALKSRSFFFFSYAEFHLGTPRPAQSPRGRGGFSASARRSGRRLGRATRSGACPGDGDKVAGAVAGALGRRQLLTLRWRLLSPGLREPVRRPAARRTGRPAAAAGASGGRGLRVRIRFYKTPPRPLDSEFRESKTGSPSVSVTCN